jgi:hypothetical protein
MSNDNGGHLYRIHRSLTCRHSLQFYSSQSCSPAELRYASNCAAKVQNIVNMEKQSGKISACNLNLRTKVEKFSLQFEPYAFFFVPCDPQAGHFF